MDNQNIAKRYRIELSSVKDIMFFFLLAWSVVLVVLSWLDFLIPHLEVSEVMVASYLVLLGAYIIHKETSRWTGVKLSIRPGELFVYVWWISLLAMLLISFFTNLVVSSPIRSLAYEVLGAFLLSEVSKSFNAYKRTGGKSD